MLVPGDGEAPQSQSDEREQSVRLGCLTVLEADVAARLRASGYAVQAGYFLGAAWFSAPLFARRLCCSRAMLNPRERLVDRRHDVSFASAIPSTSSIGTGVSGTGRYSNSSPREGRRRLARSRYLLVLVGLGLVLAFVGAVPTVEAATNGPSTSRSSVGTILPNVSCAQPNHCVVVGRTSVLATTSNGGSSWVLHRSRQNYLQGVSCPTANRCMVASYGAILKTTNDWATSKVVFYGGDAVAYGKRGLSNLNAVSCPSIAGCIAVGQEGGPPRNAGAIVTTRNAGATV